PRPASSLEVTDARLPGRTGRWEPGRLWPSLLDIRYRAISLELEQHEHHRGEHRAESQHQRNGWQRVAGCEQKPGDDRREHRTAASHAYREAGTEGPNMCGKHLRNDRVQADDGGVGAE